MALLAVLAVALWRINPLPRDSHHGPIDIAAEISNSEALENHVRSMVDREVTRVITTINAQPGVVKQFPPTEKLLTTQQKRILVTGGAGFVGSHLVDRLMRQGHIVYALDNFFTGRKENVEAWIGHPNFELIHHDVVNPYMIEVDQIYNLACPASPPHYQYNPVKTIKTSVEGTLNMLGLAKRTKARVLLTSTSEVYGDPEVHPQSETYHGRVSITGPRACYDEGKRVAETMMYAYKKQDGVDIRVARIFNTFGENMHPDDGRVVSNFIIQALQGKDITIYGDGKQTRSFQYVEDLVSGLVKLMNSDYDGPVNLGNPDEYTIREFAEMIVQMVGTKSKIVHLPSTQDDPSRRKPDISLAKRVLGWEPKVHVRTGLERTIEYFRHELERTGKFSPIKPDELKGFVAKKSGKGN
ncbi:UDP-glucose 4-epimerase [Hondaea fermentalgiana]|uniref:UDP-glucuronate decarboxylase n=1 Tax=Hondaea fermentalgiana TaxID=2315210 RepID=A0A2R5GM81_9STRA|nr:UDP-glucose 4-epimerase [Hondaea fermentalgiana]|eukprot:GBG32002.1 UDP-glucose 4-epimerase [Hondaea fermentalgiana]